MKRIRLGVGLVLGALLLVVAYLPAPWVWTDGFLAGAAAGLYLWLRDDPPEYVCRWQRGADGEIQTARALAALDAHWRARHDLESRYGNRDHVVVGPAGIFLLDSKNLGGKVALSGSDILVERRLLPDERYTQDLGRSVRGQAADLSSELAVRTGRRRWVQPVVVIWGEFRQKAVARDGVAYVHGDYLAQWLIERPPTMQPNEHAAVWKCVEALHPAGWERKVPA
jgi:hypothetical protein